MCVCCEAIRCCQRTEGSGERGYCDKETLCEVCVLLYCAYRYVFVCGGHQKSRERETWLVWYAFLRGRAHLHVWSSEPRGVVASYILIPVQRGMGVWVCMYIVCTRTRSTSYELLRTSTNRPLLWSATRPARCSSCACASAPARSSAAARSSSAATRADRSSSCARAAPAWTPLVCTIGWGRCDQSRRCGPRQGTLCAPRP